ncbi:MAG: ubiquitin-like domain-containing protein [Actinomycetota bacterium]
MVGIAMVAGVAYTAFTKHVTLVVDGRPQTIRTTSGNVQDLLGSEGISLTSGVLVAPPPGTVLADGMTVIVSPAPELPEGAFATPLGTVYQSPTDVGVWAVIGTGGLADARRLVESSGSASRAGSSPVVAVQTVVSGKVHDVLTNADTAGDLLSAMGIEPDANDRVRPSLSTPLHVGLVLRYDRVNVVTRIEAVTIPHGVRTRFFESMVPGTVKVLREGRDGVGRATYRVTMLNGKPVSRVVIGRWIERAPEPEIRRSGPESMYGGTTEVPGTRGHGQTGEASWYDPPWSGLTAAHPTLPFGTYVTVTDVETGRSVVVVIDDRGPFGPGRVIDLSPEAFQILRPLRSGLFTVQLSW